MQDFQGATPTDSDGAGTHGHTPPRCRVCGGFIHKTPNVAYPTHQQHLDPAYARRPWLHLHREDWIDNVHQAELAS